jgi:pimeloyl-ACP methyl ester carboxylesterase
MSAIQHKFANINGVTLHYAEAGEGRLVVFLHGFPEFWYVWRRHLGILGERYRAVAPDTRGINRSQVLPGVDPYKMPHLVEDVRQLVRHLGAEKAVLVGHDWGGFIAWETAIRHPEIVDRLVIVNTAHPGVFDAMLREDGDQAKASKYMLAFRSARGEDLFTRNDYAGIRRDIIDPALASGAFDQDDVAAYIEAWSQPGALTAGLNYYRANKSGPMSGDDPPPRNLADTVVEAPTLVIWGEQDPYFVIENLDRLPSVVPNLTIKRYPSNNHWVLHERPDETAELIGQFIEGEAA